MEEKKCISKNKSECTGEIDQYYSTDGGLYFLCKFHLEKCRVIVYDGINPMTKAYYDNVYKPRLEKEREI